MLAGNSTNTVYLKNAKVNDGGMTKARDPKQSADCHMTWAFGGEWWEILNSHL